MKTNSIICTILLWLTVSAFTAAVIVTLIGAGDNLHRMFISLNFWTFIRYWALCMRKYKLQISWIKRYLCFLQIQRQCTSSVHDIVLSYIALPYTLAASFCPQSQFCFFVSGQSFSNWFGSFNTYQLASSRRFRKVVWARMCVVMCRPWCHSLLLLQRMNQKLCVFVESKCFLPLKWVTACWFSTFNVSRDSKFKFTSKPG